MKKTLIFIGILVIVFFLTGCQREMQLYYNDKLYPEFQLEELIEEQLEIENGIDLEVNIMEDTEE